ncbi:MAG: LapA family protein [Pseudomonadales bacterium]|jgi:uncharacterized integral membrane protein|nr:LapA family protein [Pseudomonadales bacterium]
MGRVRSLFSLALLIALFLFFLLVGYENSEPATLGLLDWRTPPLPLFYWVVGALALGGVTGFALAGGFGVRRGLEARRMRKELEATQREIRDLRQIALDD